ncbi:MAG: hypothetical protein R2856_02235 [Caldilineaceae bacterium]
MQTYSVDVDAIFNEHIPQAVEDARRIGKKLHLLFYAHGGLVSEKNALLHAYSQLDWWRDNYVYPVFFIWETGFVEILYQLMRGENSRARSLTRERDHRSCRGQTRAPARWPNRLARHEE